MAVIIDDTFFPVDVANDVELENVLLVEISVSEIDTVLDEFFAVAVVHSAMSEYWHTFVVAFN